MLLALTWTLAVAGSWGHTPTYDEPYHLSGGVARVALGDHRLAADHPPLAQDVAALAALPAISADRVDLRTVPGYPHIDPFSYGRQLFCSGTREEADAVLHRARGAIALFAVLGAAMAWLAARSLFGRGAGLVALLLLALDPTWLAHGGLVTTDAAAAAFFAAAIVTTSFALAGARSPMRTAGRLLLAALAIAGLFVSKFSAPLVLPALVAGAACAYFRSPRTLRGAVLRRVLLLLGAAALVTFVVIWAAYGFRFKAVPDPVRDEPYFMQAQKVGGTDAAFEEMLAPKGERPTLLAAPLRFVWRHQLLPEGFVWGLAETRWNTRKRASFLAGERYMDGRVAYFPLAFLAKTPLGLQLLCLLGAAALVARTRQARATRRASAETRTAPPVPMAVGPILGVSALVFAATYGATSLMASINIGHRHLLPLEPWLAVLAAAAFAPALPALAASTATERPVVLARRLDPFLPFLRVAALVALVVAEVRSFPHWLGYFNELVGGPEGGRDLLVDSNVDWGQDLARLAQWQEREKIAPLLLSRFGTVPPSLWGVRAKELPSKQPFFGEPAAPWEPGVYAIAATQFQAVYFGWGDEMQWNDERRRALELLSEKPADALTPAENAQLLPLSFGRLVIELRRSRRPPDATVGTSFLLFRIAAQEMADLKRRSLEEPVSGRGSAAPR